MRMALVVLALLSEVRGQSGDAPRLLDEAQANIDTEKYGAAAKLAQQAIASSIAAGDKRGVAAAYKRLSDAYLPWRKLNDALDAAKQAETLATAEGDNALRSWALIAEGEALRDKADLVAARVAVESALDGFRALKDRHGEASALSSLATLFRVASERDRAAATARQAIAVNREVHDPRIEARALYTLGNVTLESRKSGDKMTRAEADATLEHLNAVLAIPSISDRLRVQTLQAIATVQCLGGQLDEWQCSN